MYRCAYNINVFLQVLSIHYNMLNLVNKDISDFVWNNFYRVCIYLTMSRLQVKVNFLNEVQMVQK